MSNVIYCMKCGYANKFTLGSKPSNCHKCNDDFEVKPQKPKIAEAANKSIDLSRLEPITNEELGISNDNVIRLLDIVGTDEE